jgi:hypothetical protein
MKRSKGNLGFKFAVKAAAAAIVLSCCASTAMAAPITFQWSPSAAGFAGAADITADSITVSDYANITFPGTSCGSGICFTDVGFLPIQTFINSGTTVIPTGLNSTYTLYLAFNGAGSVNHAALDSTTQGTFTTLDYGLWIVAGNAAFKPSLGDPGATATINGSAAPLGTLLAHGSLIAGGVGTTCAGDVCTPTASAIETFIEDMAGFFLSPPSTTILDLFANFTNTQPEIFQTANGFNIVQGGGTMNLQQAASIPEPGTLAVVGGVLLGFAGLRRKKAKTRK